MRHTWECSECKVENDLDAEPEAGQIVACEECGNEFEIVRVAPIEIVPLEIPETDDVAETEVEADADGDEDWE